MRWCQRLWKGSHALRTRMALSFLVVILGASTTLVLLYAQFTREALCREANQTLYAAALYTATTIDTFLNTNKAAVHAEAMLPEIVAFVSMSPEQRAGALEEGRILEVLNTLRRKDFFHIESYGILDRHGLNIADTSRPFIGQDESAMDYFQHPFETGLPYISPVRFAEHVGGVYFHFSAPIRNEVGLVRGVLRVRYSVGFLQQLVASTRGSAGPGSFGLLLDEHGLRLAHDTSPELLFKTLVPLEDETAQRLRAEGRLPNLPPEHLATHVPAFQAGILAAAEHPFFVADVHDGHTPPEQVAVVPLVQQPWYVVFAQSQDKFLTPINRAIRLTIIWATVVASLVTAVAFGVVRWLTNPVIHLTQVVEKITAGDLTIEARVESRDEIGRLALAFNAMTARLRQMLEGLQQSNAQLQQEIHERQRIEEERRLLFEEEQQQRLLAETLREVTLALTSQRGMEAVLEEVLEQARRIVPYVTAHIALLEGEKLRPVRWSGYVWPEAEHYICTLCQYLTDLPIDETAMQDCTPVLIADTFQDPRWQLFAQTAWIRSYLVLPICLQSRVLGVLRLHGDTPNFFVPMHVQRLLPLVSAAAIAIEKAALVEGLEAEVAARTAEIRAEKERSETILRSIAAAIVMTDCDMRIQYINPAYTRLTGFTLPEVQGQSLYALVDITPDLPLHIPSSKGAESRVWEGETQARRKDGSTYDVALTLAPVYDALGQRIGFVASHQDISWRIHFERARQQFLTRVSHELRTPITVIQLNLQFLQHNSDPAKARTYLQNATQASKELLDLVQRLLAVVAVEMEPAVTEWRPIDLERVIAELVAYRQGRAATQVAALQVLPRPPDLPQIRGHPERLTHALKEILDNALSFTPATGEVILSLRAASYMEYPGIEIIIADNGPGIRPEEHQQVFELFYRGEAAYALSLPGIGLGLSVAQRIIQAHGGHISLESTPGTGSIFTVWLPAA